MPNEVHLHERICSGMGGKMAEEEWTMKHKIYALYKGETLLADGTTKEIAEKMGITVRSVLYYRTPAYQRRAKTVRNRRMLVLLGDC